MKIKINDNESYETNINDISLQDLDKLVTGLKSISFHVPNVKPIFETKKRTYQHSNNFNKRKQRSDIGKNHNGYERTTGLTRKGQPRRREFTPRGLLPYTTDRNEFLKALKVLYFGTKEDKKEYANKVSKIIGKERGWDEIVKQFWTLRIKFNPTPQEIGLDKFPSRGEFDNRNPLRTQEEEQLEQEQEEEEQDNNEVKYL